MVDTLYLRGVEYNMARVIEKMADIVAEKGGNVKFTGEGMTIKTRGYNPHIEKTKKDIERMETFLRDTEGVYGNTSEDTKASLREAVKKQQAEVERLEMAKQDAPVIKSRFMTKHGMFAGCIKFTLGGLFWCFDFADNPFFPDTYAVALYREDGGPTRYTMRCLTEEDEPKPYFADDLWSPCASDETIHKTARDILARMLEEAKKDKRLRDLLGT